MDEGTHFVLPLSWLAVGVVENHFSASLHCSSFRAGFFFSSVFGLLASALLVVASAAPRLTLSPFCRMTLKSHAGPSFPNVSADLIGLNSVPEIPALPMVILGLS